MASKLKARYDESYESRDKGGTPRNGVMDWKKGNGEVAFYKPEEGRNVINIIPYEVHNSQHPLVRAKKMEIGDLDYVYDAWTHASIGPDEVDVICLKKTYGKGCPVCEEAEKYKEKGDEETYKDLKAKRRVWYNVQDLEADDPEKIKVFSVSHFLFEHELIEEARNGTDGEEQVDFADIEDGKEIHFRAASDNMGGNDFFRYKSFKFEDRDKELNPKILKQVHPLDEMIIFRDYEQVEKILFRGLEEEAAEDKGEGKPKSDKLESKPRPEKAEKKSSLTECPHNHEFGKDTDNFDDCVKCKSYAECEKALKDSRKKGK